jgi:dihydroxyacetone kinase-like protein
MLDAACAGEVFTSPVPDQMVAATQGVDGGAGVLHIVKNYTGDVLNFEMAAEIVAADSGTEVQTVVVDDDVAVQDSLYTAGRRGVGLTVLLEKIVGAAAEEMQPLADIAELARKVNGQGRSMGLALTSCTVPSAGGPTFDLPAGEMELGVGIHGEPGRSRVPVAPARELAQMLIEPVLGDLDFTAGDGVIAFVNGLGATPLLELYLLYGEVQAILEKSGVSVARSLVGPYITSLDMAGCSLTLLRADDELLRLWDAPVARPACAGASRRGGAGRTGQRRRAAFGRWIGRVRDARRGAARRADPARLAIGDADHGSNLHRGMTAVVSGACRRLHPPSRLPCLKKVGMTLVSKVGGAERAPLRHAVPADGRRREGGSARSDRLRRGAARRGPRGAGARQGRAGDKTMLDALLPACDALDAAVEAARAWPTAWLRLLRRPATAATPRPRCWRARAGPATSASAAWDTRTPARRLPLCCCRPRSPPCRRELTAGWPPWVWSSCPTAARWRRPQSSWRAEMLQGQELRVEVAPGSTTGPWAPMPPPSSRPSGPRTPARASSC